MEQYIFEVVQNPENYKLPTTPFFTDSEEEARTVGRAIAYYVGGYEFAKIGDQYRVTSEGYYHYIGA